MSLELESEKIRNGSEIPREHTCEGADRSPPLRWSGVPDGTRSLALVVEDPDAPNGTFIHWVVYGIPPQARMLGEGIPPEREILPEGVKQGRNDFGRMGWGGPCPPRGETHRYRFRLFALDAGIRVGPGASWEQLDHAIAGHVLEEAELIGRFHR